MINGGVLWFFFCCDCTVLVEGFPQAKHCAVTPPWRKARTEHQGSHPCPSSTAKAAYSRQTRSAQRRSEARSRRYRGPFKSGAPAWRRRWPMGVWARLRAGAHWLRRTAGAAFGATGAVAGGASLAAAAFPAAHRFPGPFQVLLFGFALRECLS